MQITDITKQKKGSERFNLFLDGKYYCALNAEVIVKNKLKIGMEVEASDIDSMQLITEKQYVLTRSVKYLGSKLKTEKQFRDYLTGKGYTAAVIEFVISKLTEYKFIDDSNFSDSYIRCKSKTSGKRRIAVQLKQKGVDENLIKEKVQTITDEWETVSALAQKYMSGKEKNQANAAKLFNFLQYRGFSYEDCRRAVREFTQEDEGQFDN